MAESHLISDHISSYYSQDSSFVVETELEAIRLGYLGSIPSRCRIFFSAVQPCGPPRLSGVGGMVFGCKTVEGESVCIHVRLVSG